MPFTWIRKIIKSYKHKRAWTRQEHEGTSQEAQATMSNIRPNIIVPFLVSPFHTAILYEYILGLLPLLCSITVMDECFYPSAPTLHLNQCASITVLLAHTEFVAICNKEHFMVGQSVRICTHEGPLSVRAYYNIFLW